MTTPHLTTAKPAATAADWETLLDTLSALERHAKNDTPQGVAQLERTIVLLGKVARGLSEAPPPDHTTTLRLHTQLNTLGAALPNERAVLREKITGLVKRAYAQQAYSKMSANKMSAAKKKP